MGAVVQADACNQLVLTWGPKLLPPMMECACLDTMPGLTTGSRRSWEMKLRMKGQNGPRIGGKGVPYGGRSAMELGDRRNRPEVVISKVAATELASKSIDNGSRACLCREIDSTEAVEDGTEA
jgi:hypothetical protein